VVIAAWVVEESTWSKGNAPAIKNLRERYLSRSLIPKAHTARKRAVMDLVVGRDNRRIFQELSQEACLMGMTSSSATSCSAQDRWFVAPPRRSSSG
jgi:hypothetical protein